MRKRENKNYPSVPFLPEAWENSKKMAKKLKKLKNIIVSSLQAKIGLKRLGKRENKNYRFVSFLSEA